jgi:diphthine-ammonia ligase
MYQTVGQDAVALVAQALGVPLYRRVIQGNPVEQAAEYGLKSAGGGGIAGDETEDLHALLCNVLEHHPDIQAVSVGAILSNYQRVRVEHVSVT